MKNTPGALLTGTAWRPISRNWKELRGALNSFILKVRRSMEAIKVIMDTMRIMVNITIKGRSTQQTPSSMVMTTNMNTRRLMRKLLNIVIHNPHSLKRAPTVRRRRTRVPRKPQAIKKLPTRKLKNHMVWQRHPIISTTSLRLSKGNR